MLQKKINNKKEGYRMEKRWRKITFLGLTAFILSACGAGQKSQSEDTTGSIEEVVSQTSMPDRPFVYAAQQNVGTIDPAKVLDQTEVISAVNLYDPLFAPERTDGSMSPVPHVAEDYTVSEDGKTYTLTIRDDIQFHSGNKLTAEDVKYSMERMIAIGEGSSWLWSNLLEKGSITAEDDQTVVFSLNKAYAPFISSLTQLFVVDSEVLKENERGNDYGQMYLTENEAGSGPYTLDNWERESQIEFKAFEDYWLGWEEGQLEEVQMKFISEESTAKILLVSGQADMIHEFMTPSTYEEFGKTDGIVVQEDVSGSIQEMPMNTQKAPTDDLNVRKAIASVFDYDAANDHILGGSTKAAGPVPLSVEGHSDDVLVFERDVEKAKKFLAQSDYAGEELNVTFMYIGDQADQRQYSQLIRSNLQELGIEVTFEQATWPQVTEAVSSIDTTANLTVISDALTYPHVDSQTYGKYHPTSHGSYRSAAWLDKDSITEKLDQAREEVDVEKQEALYEEAQVLITEEVPSIYITNATHRISFRDYVKEYTFIPLTGYDLAFYYLRAE